MHDTTKVAIRERIEYGSSKEEIIKELSAAGYPAALAEELYEAVTTETSSTAFTEAAVPVVVKEHIVAESDIESAEPDMIESQAVVETDSVQTKSRFSAGVVAAGVVLVVLLVSGVAYSFVYPLFFAAAPYATEAAMMEGIIDHTKKLTAHGFNLSYLMAIEKQSEGTLSFNQNLLPIEIQEGFRDQLETMVQSGALPEEAEARVDVSGLIDVRDKAKPEFDIAASVHVLAEPIVLNVGGSLRLADGVLYGKIDDLPENFKPFLGPVPIETWLVLVEKEEDISLPAELPFPISAPQVWRVVPPDLQTLFVAEIKRLTTLPLFYAAQSKDYLAAQVAQLGMPLLEVDEDLEKQAMLLRSMELLKKYPPVRFITAPQSAEVDGEKVYHYAVDVNFENVAQYIIAMSKEASTITGETAPDAEGEVAEFFATNKALLEEFNRLTTIIYTFRADGSLAGIQFASTFTFDHPEFERQFRMEMNLSTTRQNDALDIVRPEIVHEKSISEIFKAGLDDARQKGAEAAIKSTLSMMRAQAELAYNDSAQSYISVCVHEGIQPFLETVVTRADLKGTQRDAASDMFTVTCNDSDNAYAIISPLTANKEIAFCVDSTGFAGEVLPTALTSGTDTTCE